MSIIKKPVPAKCASHHRSTGAGHLDEQIVALEQLSYVELQAEWRRLYRSQPPKKISRELLELAIAWKLQEKVLGGLSGAAKRQLGALALTLSTGGEIAKPRTVAIKRGARLVREWNGDTHDVMVVKDGFQWRGQHWRSLSAIAREITGTRWSGPRFFGLHPSGKQAAPNSILCAQRELPEAVDE